MPTYEWGTPRQGSEFLLTRSRHLTLGQCIMSPFVMSRVSFFRYRNSIEANNMWSQPGPTDLGPMWPMQFLPCYVGGGLRASEGRHAERDEDSLIETFSFIYYSEATVRCHLPSTELVRNESTWPNVGTNALLLRTRVSFHLPMNEPLSRDREY